MIAVTNLTKRYGPLTAVDDVSFTCQPGTITGFLGPNGAGKTTTLRMITGLARSDGGRATVAGQAFADLPNPTRIARHTAGRLGDPRRAHGARDPADRRHRDRNADGRASRRCWPSSGWPARRPPGRHLLAGDAPAARPGAGPPRRAQRADPRRTRHRPRPAGHRLDPRLAAGLRRPGRHRAALQPPAGRGAGDRRPSGRHQRREDRGPGIRGRAARRGRVDRAGHRPGSPGAAADPQLHSVHVPAPAARYASIPVPRRAPSGSPGSRWQPDCR